MVCVLVFFVVPQFTHILVAVFLHTVHREEGTRGPSHESQTNSTVLVRLLLSMMEFLSGSTFVEGSYSLEAILDTLLSK